MESKQACRAALSAVKSASPLVDEVRRLVRSEAEPAIRAAQAAAVEAQTSILYQASPAGVGAGIDIQNRYAQVRLQALQREKNAADAEVSLLRRVLPVEQLERQLDTDEDQRATIMFCEQVSGLENGWTSFATALRNATQDDDIVNRHNQTVIEAFGNISIEIDEMRSASNTVATARSELDELIQAQRN